MNELLHISNQKSSTLTMSSIEIAQLCEKRHDNVMADIRKMLDELKIQSPEFSGDYMDSKGRTYSCFYSQTLVTGLGIEWIAKHYATELMS